ncbi:unnamed protein product [Caenorhabditis sp. 36 PRJEB53466]|nr:unnamed protein product [Caenorhabditis sp. 36 PRJEB53466]
MNWLFRVLALFVLIITILLYYWILKNKTIRTESMIFKDVDNLPELTFSKLADLESRMAAELEAIPIEKFDETRRENIEKFRNSILQNSTVASHDHSTINVIALMCMIIVATVIILCIIRIFLKRKNLDSDSDRIPFANIYSHHTFPSNSTYIYFPNIDNQDFWHLVCVIAPVLIGITLVIIGVLIFFFCKCSPKSTATSDDYDSYSYLLTSPRSRKLAAFGLDPSRKRTINPSGSSERIAQKLSLILENHLENVQVELLAVLYLLVKCWVTLTKEKPPPVDNGNEIEMV